MKLLGTVNHNTKRKRERHDNRNNDNNNNNNNNKAVTRRTDRGVVEERLLRSTYSVYFFAFLAMTFCQAIGMILFGLTSYSLHNESLYGPMEIFMLSHLWIHHHHHHHHQDGSRSSSRMEDDDDDLHRATAVNDDLSHLEEFLVNQTAQRLQQLDQHHPLQQQAENKNNNNNTAIYEFLQAMRNDTNALDDYYQRRHIVPQHGSLDLPILIVGGSDGSGTRAFVELLQNLGVPMLIDDQGTKDVHAPVLYKDDEESVFGGNNKKNNHGWPPLVQVIMNETHSANYRLEQLHPRTLSSVLHQMKRFKLSYAPQTKELIKNVTAAKRQQQQKQKQGTNNNPTPFANHVQYGFKAPVTMLLLPLLLQTFGRIKFLHVVRDGRDVAFSLNDSPVQKFYAYYYADAPQRQGRNQGGKQVQAMQLWNDWNSQALQWERQTAKRDPHNFDFLVVRTEDLLSPETKLESLVRLADFVGSTRSRDDLCCLSRQGIVDMGESANGLKRARRRRRRRHHDPFDARPPGAPSNQNEEKERMYYDDDPTTTLDLDDPSGISMERIALETERKALDMVLQKRPQVYQKIQQARQDNFAKHHDHRHRHHHQAPPPDTAKLQPHNIKTMERDDSKHAEVAAGWDRFLFANRPPRQQQQRRLSEASRNKAHHRDGQIMNTKSLSVLQRYGKWRSILEQQPDLSNVLHTEGKQALEMFGYEPPRRFADLPPTGMDDLTVCHVDCSAREQQATA